MGTRRGQALDEHVIGCCGSVGGGGMLDEGARMRAKQAGRRAAIWLLWDEKFELPQNAKICTCEKRWDFVKYAL